MVHREEDDETITWILSPDPEPEQDPAQTPLYIVILVGLIGPVGIAIIVWALE